MQKITKLRKSRFSSTYVILNSRFERWTASSSGSRLLQKGLPPGGGSARTPSIFGNDGIVLWQAEIRGGTESCIRFIIRGDELQ